MANTPAKTAAPAAPKTSAAAPVAAKAAAPAAAAPTTYERVIVHTIIVHREGQKAQRLVPGRKGQPANTFKFTKAELDSIEKSAPGAVRVLNPEYNRVPDVAAATITDLRQRDADGNDIGDIGDVAQPEPDAPADDDDERL